MAFNAILLFASIVNNKMFSLLHVGFVLMSSYIATVGLNDFLILMIPNIAIIIPTARTAPNSRTALSARFPPCMPRIIAVPIMINAPPIIIKIPIFCDGSFLVIKNDMTSMADGIIPKIDPLTEGFI